MSAFNPSADLARTTTNATSFSSHTLEQCKNWGLACKDASPIAGIPPPGRHPTTQPCHGPVWAEQGCRGVLRHQPHLPMDQLTRCAKKPPGASVPSSSDVTCSANCNLCPGQGCSGLRMDTQLPNTLESSTAQPGELSEV